MHGILDVIDTEIIDALRAYFGYLPAPLRALSVFREMERRGEVPIRSALTHSVGVAVYPDAGEFYKRLGDVTNMGTDMLWYPGIGVVNVDGSFESVCTTLNRSNPCLIARPDDVKRRALFEGIKAGNRVTGTHTGGDLAIDHMLDVIEEASRPPA